MLDRIKPRKTAAHLNPNSTSSAGLTKRLTIAVNLRFSEQLVLMTSGRLEARVTRREIHLATLRDNKRVTNRKKDSQSMLLISNNNNRETNYSFHLNYK